MEEETRRRREGLKMEEETRKERNASDMSMNALSSYLIIEDCPTLQYLELHRCTDSVLRDIATCRNLQIFKLVGHVVIFFLLSLNCRASSSSSSSRAQSPLASTLPQSPEPTPVQSPRASTLLNLLIFFIATELAVCGGRERLSSTVLEVTRAAHEEVDWLEGMIVKELQNEPARQTTLLGT
ncbi:hypothetical protein Fmac_023797 [Flemingia macrophylla]|uniref:Uncharacterized protein n=1 Tax=Flemingia macrophylla TaxID=520843 RepID=A0ABD1LMJ3_9FABA